MGPDDMGFPLGQKFRLRELLKVHVGFVHDRGREVGDRAPARLGSRALPVFVRVPTKKRNYTKNAGPVALAAMEEHSGAYMRLLHNVF